MKVLITGANGQLGQSILNHPSKKDDFTFLPTDFPELDITDESRINAYCGQHDPEAIVNCAGYTAVDKAEQEKDRAMLINAVGPEILAKVCFERSIPLIHISTDYIFSGNAHQPYSETDETGPLSAYGVTKLDGENRVLTHHNQAIILRTSWLYSEYGGNFVKTMLRLGNEREEIGVVYDQVGSPTYAGDLAEAILQILRMTQDPGWPLGNRLYHYCNTGLASWFDFAKEVMSMTGYPCSVNPLSSEEYPLPAPRPYYSVLSTKKFREEIGDIPYWKESLRSCIKRLIN